MVTKNIFRGDAKIRKKQTTKTTQASTNTNIEQRKEHAAVKMNIYTKQSEGHE